MKVSLKKIILPNNDIRPLGFLISLLLSWIWFVYQQPINIDGVTYLHTAAAFTQHGLKAAIQTYNWPLYPILIALVSKFTLLSALNSAYLLNAIFTGLIVVAFVSIIRNLHAPINIQYLACLVILIYAPLAQERTMLLRDFGYYAFALFSLNSLINYQNSKKFVWLFSWSLLILVASLFRAEGLAFLVLVPFAFLFDFSLTPTQRILSFIKANVLSIIIVCIIGIYVLIFAEHNTIKLILIDLLQKNLQWCIDLLTSWHKDIAQLQQHVLPIYGFDQAKFFYFAGPLGIFIALLIFSLSYVYAILILYSQKINAFKISSQFSLVIWAYIIVNLIVLFLFLYSQLFLTTRYIMFLALILILQVPYVIAAIYRQFNCKQWPTWLLSIVLIIMCLTTVIHIGANRSFVITASQWIQQNVPKNKKMLVNDPILDFYINYPSIVDGNLTAEILKHSDHLAKALQNFNYIIIQVSNKKTNAIESFSKLNNFTLVKQFENNYHDKIYVLKVR